MSPTPSTARGYLRDSILSWVPPDPQQMGRPSVPQPSELVVNLGDKESEKHKERKAGRARVGSLSKKQELEGPGARGKNGQAGGEVG